MDPRTATPEAGAGRLLLVSEYYPPRIFGGGEISAELLARGLAGRGFEVWVLTSETPELAREETKDSVRVVRALSTGPSPHSILNNVRRGLLLPPSIRRQVARLTAERRFDAVLLLGATTVVSLAAPAPVLAVINFYPPFCPKGTLYFQERGECSGCAPGKFVSCITRSQYVGNNRMPWVLRYNPLFWLGLYLQFLRRRRGLSSVDGFVAISGFVEGVLRAHGVPAERIARIYNIARIDDRSDVPEELAAVLEGRRVVTFLGKLEKLKGPQLAIRGFAAWRSGSDLLLLAGEGSERPQLEALCRELGIAGAVYFAGQVAQRHLPFLYRSSWAIVLPSQWPEPFSRIVMEAAWFRRPLLASKRGGNRDLPPAHLFESPEELASKLRSPPVPDFAPYDPERNLDAFVRLLGDVTSARGG